MLFISVNRINTKVNSNNKNNVYAILIDYSKKGLVKNKSELFWRISGDIKNGKLQDFHQAKMKIISLPKFQIIPLELPLNIIFRPFQIQQKKRLAQ